VMTFVALPPHPTEDTVTEKYYHFEQ